MKYYHIDTLDKRDIPKKYFINIFKNNKYWKYVNNNQCNFSYNITKKTYNMKCDIGFRFNNNHRQYLTNKSNLYHTLKKDSEFIVDKIMLSTYDFTSDDKVDSVKELFKTEKILIVRPTWGFARKSILVFDNYNKFKEFMETEGYNEINKANMSGTRKLMSNTENKQIINEKYILNRFIEGHLYKDCVYNFRVFMLVSLVNNNYYCSYINNHIIHLGDIPYKDGKKYINTDVVTGLISGSINDVMYNEYLKSLTKEQGEHITKQIDYIVRVLFHITKKHKYMKSYDNYKSSYEIFGLDLIVTKEFQVILVEMNDKTGLNNYDDMTYIGLTNMIIDMTINKTKNKEYHIKIPDDIKMLYTECE
jgi:hypothetical protein